MFDKLKRWLNGDADWNAEQELQHLGKKDAFLSDAMEGYQSLPEADHAQAISDLKGKINKQYTSKGSRSTLKTIPWKSAAAALVGVIGLFYWTQREISPSEVVAESYNPPKIENAQTVEADKALSTAPEPVEFEAKESEVEEDIAINESTPLPKVQVDPSNIEAGVITESDANAEDAIVSYTSTSDFVSIDSLEGGVAVSEPIATSEADVRYASEDIDQAVPAAADQTPPAPNARKAESVPDQIKNTIPENISNSTSIVAVEKTLNGMVTDLESEEGLIGVSVYIQGTGEGTVTDFDGNFSLTSTSPLPWTLISSYTGYSDEVFAVTEIEEDFKIVMNNEGVALDEVVVTGYSATKKKKSKRSKDKVQEPEPIIGFKKMKRYIRNNLKYPELAKTHKIQGGVTIRFFINEEGKPEEFTLLNGLGSGCDKEAERLIEEGPKWKPVNTWAIYTVVFNL